MKFVVYVSSAWRFPITDDGLVQPRGDVAGGGTGEQHFFRGVRCGVLGRGCLDECVYVRLIQSFVVEANFADFSGKIVHFSESDAQELIRGQIVVVGLEWSGDGGEFPIYKELQVLPFAHGSEVFPSRSYIVIGGDCLSGFNGENFASDIDGGVEWRTGRTGDGAVDAAVVGDQARQANPFASAALALVGFVVVDGDGIAVGWREKSTQGSPRVIPVVATEFGSRDGASVELPVVDEQGVDLRAIDADAPRVFPAGVPDVAPDEGLGPSPRVKSSLIDLERVHLRALHGVAFVAPGLAVEGIDMTGEADEKPPVVDSHRVREEALWLASLEALGELPVCAAFVDVDACFLIACTDVELALEGSHGGQAFVFARLSAVHPVAVAFVAIDAAEFVVVRWDARPVVGPRGGIQLAIVDDHGTDARGPSRAEVPAIRPFFPPS